MSYHSHVPVTRNHCFWFTVSLGYEGQNLTFWNEVSFQGGGGGYIVRGWSPDNGIMAGGNRENIPPKILSCHSLLLVCEEDSLHDMPHCYNVLSKNRGQASRNQMAWNWKPEPDDPPQLFVGSILVKAGDNSRKLSLDSVNADSFPCFVSTRRSQPSLSTVNHSALHM